MTDFSRFEDEYTTIGTLVYKTSELEDYIADNPHDVIRSLKDELDLVEDLKTFVYCHENLISVVEEYALDNDLISSEEELSKSFDELCEECPPEYDYHTDKPALNEDFNNYKDCLLSDNRLHAKQVDNYVYVGKYEN